jgi:hypothetical protein
MTKTKFKKKWENYWFYYKTHTIVAVIAIIVVGLLIKQCAERVEPDMTVIIVSQSVSMTEDQLTSVENMLAKYTSDVNGDGKKVVSCENFCLGSSQDTQTTYALQQKLMAEIAATDTALFITDDSYYKNLNQDGDMFYKLNKVYSAAPDSDRVLISDLPDFKISGLGDDFGKLSLSLRSFGSDTPNSGKNSDSVNNSIKVLKKLLKNGGLVK